VKILTNAAINAISWYQREISPKKGFCCAYHVLHGHGSCSSVVKNAFHNHGTIAGIFSVFSQAKKCHSAYVALSEQEHGKSDKETEGNASFCAKWAALKGASCCFTMFLVNL
jgi:putative component of membrane protein insertase Oxa1/YidC/SpoIIIJ protein YidD